jgi:hypothetical protein
VACVLIAAVAFGIVKKKQKDQLTLRTNLNTAIHAMDDEIIIGKRAYGVYESYLGSLVPIGEYNVQNNNFNTVDECLSKVLDVKASSDYSDDIGKLLDSYTVVNHILFKQIYVDESNADSLYDMTDFKNALNDYDAAKESVRTTMYNNMKPKHKKISDEKKEELKGEAYVLFETIGDAAQDFINGDANADVFALADISGDAGVNINDEMPYCTAYVNYKIYGSGDDITGVDLIYYDIETGYCIKLSDDGINEDEEELDSYLAYTDIDISGLYSDL